MSVWDRLDRLLPEPTKVDFAGMPCTWCGGPSEGHHAIHTTNSMSGDEVPLCDDCGGEHGPTCEQIWDKIAQFGATTTSGHRVEPGRRRRR